MARRLSSEARYAQAKALIAADTYKRRSRMVFYNNYVTMRSLKVCYPGGSNPKLAKALAALADSVVKPTKLESSSWSSYYRAPIYRFNKAAR